MKINTALILCAGFGKRLNPITLTKPKPLLQINEVTMLEKSINLIKEMGINKIFINTFYLKEHFSNFIKNKNFNLDIHIIEDGKSILDTGGGILNMISKSDEDDFIVFNPDTIWSNRYRDEITKMEEIYFSKKLDNILLLVNKNLSFDQSLAGDFNLSNNLISKTDNLDFIYIGCQILNKKILANQTISKFSILNIWNKLIDEKKLYGFESKQKFYHLTDLNIFNKLKDL
ncbi:NTP transferase domain-containing protein [Pelagibacterales bacterium SAG-MED18]|nr:NTP transferase domain-containing protein [Pelagibacterales bacterium SAG-MED18]